MTQAMIRRLAFLYQTIFRTFLFMNGIMIGVAVLNIIQSSSLHFRIYFWFFFYMMIQFWIMMLLFFFLSVSLKVCIHMISAQSGEENADWVRMLMIFPEEREEELYQMMAHESLQTTTTPVRNAPTMDKLLKMDLDWGSYIRPLEQLTDPQKDEKCLICLQTMEQPTPTIQGVVRLACACQTLFHKKCILEWFHFNAKDADDDGPGQVTCPSCRHVFIAVP